MVTTQGTQSEATPRQVTVAIYLLGAAFIFSVLRAVLTREWSDPGSHVVPIAILIAIYFAWIYGLVRRLNWLRWLTIVFSSLGLVSLPWWLPNVTDHTQHSLHILQCIVQVPATVLLCFPEAQGWYGRAAA